jgi:hypothetical protein
MKVGSRYVYGSSAFVRLVLGTAVQFYDWAVCTRDLQKRDGSIDLILMTRSTPGTTSRHGSQPLIRRLRTGVSGHRTREC